MTLHVVSWELIHSFSLVYSRGQTKLCQTIKTPIFLCKLSIYNKIIHSERKHSPSYCPAVWGCWRREVKKWKSSTMEKDAAACSSNPTRPASVKYFPEQIPSSSGDTTSSETADSSKTLEDMFWGDTRDKNTFTQFKQHSTLSILWKAADLQSNPGISVEVAFYFCRVYIYKI